MEKKDVEEIKNIINRLVTEKSDDLIYKGIYIRLVTSTHPLADILEKQQCQLPLLLATGEKSPDQIIPVRKSCQTPNVPITPATPAEDKASISFFGSPLELETVDLDCTVFDFDAQKIMYRKEKKVGEKPVSLSKARLLLSLYNLATPQLPPSSICPFWVLCDGKDRRHVIAMAADVTMTSSGISYRSLMTTLSGPKPGDEMIISLQKLMQEQRKLCPKNVGQYEVQYVFRGRHLLDEGDIDDDNRESYVTAVLRWDKDLNHSLQNPPLDASTCLHVDAVAGSQYSKTYSIYTQLKALQRFLSGLNDNCEIEWTVEEGVDDEYPWQETKLLIEKVRRGEVGMSTATNTKNNEEKIQEISINRSDLDFSEMLWNIWRGCASRQQLGECLQYVLDCLQRGDIQPMVHRSNKCEFAELVRKSYFGSMSSPDISGSHAVRMLIEMGMDKLCRDYASAFVGNDLVPFSQIQPLLQGEEIVVRVAGLARLHHTLEVILLLEHQLNMPRLILSQITSQLLKHYQKLPVKEGHVFKLPVPTSVVHGPIAKRWPSQGRVSVMREENQKKLFTVHHMMTEPPLHAVEGIETAKEKETVDTSPDDTCTENIACDEAESMIPKYFMTSAIENVVILPKPC